MRVLHVTECRGGGVVRAMVLAAASVPEADHLFVGPEQREERLDGFDVVGTVPTSHVGAMRSLAAAVRRHRPDVVHAHSSWAGVWARSRALPVPVVYQPHCYRFADPAMPAAARTVVRLVERALASRTAATIALTEWERREALGLGSPAVHLLPNRATVRPVRVSTSPRARRVVMVGRIAPQKDPALFASIAHRVRQVDPTTTFRWVGGGDPGLRRLLESHQVEVTGWVDDDRLADEVGEAMLYVHTASYEGFPLSVLDAAALGTPVLARAIPAFDGSGVTTFATAEAATGVISEVLRSTDAWQALAVSTAEVPRRLTETADATDLRRVYSEAMGVPA